MSGVTTKQVVKGEDGMRLDRWFVVHFPQFTHGQVQKCLRKGQIRVDGGRAKANERLQAGQMVRVPPLPKTSLKERLPVLRQLSPQDFEFVRSLVIYKDDDFLAINKPSGFAVQGGSGQGWHLDGLLDGLKFKTSERPKLVHRLDKDTSGVLLLARSREAAAAMGRILKARESIKLYWALVVGVPRTEEATIDMPLVKGKTKAGERMLVDDGEDEEHVLSAVSRYKVIGSAGQQLAFVALSPVTGRTHQLRVHMSAVGHPIVGDGKYGGAKAHPGGEISRRLHLHARSFTFTHPKTGRRVTISAPLSSHMEGCWDLFGFDKNDNENPFDPASCRGSCRVF